MSANIRVIITAVETVRLERVIEIPRERFAKYQEMVEYGAGQLELTAEFGDLFRESPDVADSLGLEDLKISPAPRACDAIESKDVGGIPSVSKVKR